MFKPQNIGFVFIARVAKRNNSLAAVETAEAVYLTQGGLAAEEDGIAKHGELLFHKAENGVIDTPLRLVHHVEAVIKLPEGSASCRHCEKIFTEFVVGQRNLRFVSVNRIVVIKITCREAKLTHPVKIIIPLVTVGEKLVLLRAGQLLSVCVLFNHADVVARLNPDGVDPL